MNSLMNLGYDERGAATTEYALLLAVFSLAVVSVLTGLGVGITDVMAAVTTALDTTPVDATTPVG
ncbi:MAG: Flp family type IVb pilin [Myxococcales bacterium]|nr:MAG: Flp family type IVb pilin [Myxococcales bacterium]